MRVIFLFLISFALASHAIALDKSIQKIENTGANLPIEHLSQLFYPTDVLDKFDRIPLSIKQEHCQMRGDISQLNMIDVPQKISGLTSRMFGSTDLIGVDETSEFVRIFNNLAAQAFFTRDEKLKNNLANALFKLAQNGALMANELCGKDGEIICAPDWLDDEGQDKSGKRDSNFAHNMATRLSYAYYAYVKNEKIEAGKSATIDNWFDHFAAANLRPKFEFSTQGGGFVHAMVRAIIEKNSNRDCFGEDCEASMLRLFAKLDNSINEDGSIYPNTFRGDRALYYHNDALNEIFVLMEMGRRFGYAPSKEFLSRVEKAIEIFLAGWADHSFMDKWANEGINGRVRPGIQQFGVRKFRENPSSSWYYIFLHRYPNSPLSRELVEKYEVNNLDRSDADMMWAMSYKCIYNLVTKSEQTLPMNLGSKQQLAFDVEKIDFNGLSIEFYGLADFDDFVKFKGGIIDKTGSQFGDGQLNFGLMFDFQNSAAKQKNKVENYKIAVAADDLDFVTNIDVLRECKKSSYWEDGDRIQEVNIQMKDVADNNCLFEKLPVETAKILQRLASEMSSIVNRARFKDQEWKGRINDLMESF